MRAHALTSSSSSSHIYLRYGVYVSVQKQKIYIDFYNFKRRDFKYIYITNKKERKNSLKGHSLDRAGSSKLNIHVVASFYI
jgi:hypothetical protein